MISVRIAMAGLALIGTMSPCASPASASAHPREDRNLALVLKFSEAVYNRRDFALAKTMLADDFIQHNPKIPTGRRGFIDSYSAVVAHHPGLHSQILRSAADHDLVWTHVHVTDASGTYHMALINIFRIAAGKIVEHWDVIQPVPDNAANTNTMF